jgi:hypothetical protein
MTTKVTEAEINTALIDGMKERIKLREAAINKLDEQAQELGKKRLKLTQEIKKIKDFIEER